MQYNGLMCSPMASRGLGVVLHLWKRSKKPGGCPIDRDICALSRQNGGKQELVWLMPSEFTMGIRMGFGQRVVNPASPGPGRGGGCGQRKWKIGASFGHPEADILGVMHQAFSARFVIRNPPGGRVPFGCGG